MPFVKADTKKIKSGSADTKKIKSGSADPNMREQHAYVIASLTAGQP